MTSVSKNESFDRKRSRLPVEVEAIIYRTIKIHLYRSKNFSVKILHHLIVSQLLEVNKYREEDKKLTLPSYSTVYQRVRAFEQKQTGDVDPIKEKKVKLFKMEGQYPMQRVVVESLGLNVIILDEETNSPLGRPWLTIILDTYSMYPLGFYVHFEVPSYQSVMLALKHAINPKNVKSKYPDVQNEWHAYGLPETLIVDNGWEFQSNLFKEACHRLKINLEYRRKSPPQKGAMERFFKKLNEEFSEKTHDKYISFKSLQRLIHMWILDSYSENYNTGAKGVPAVIWREHMQNTPITAPTLADNLLLLENRKLSITSKGIQYDGLTYLSPALLKLSVKLDKLGLNKRVLCKYDPTDSSCIYVYDEVDKEYVNVPNTNLEYIKYLDVRKGVVTVEHSKQKKNVDTVFRDVNKKLIGALPGKKAKQLRRDNFEEV